MSELVHLKIQAYEGERFVEKILILKEDRVLDLRPSSPHSNYENKSPLYLSPGFIDSHAHVYDGATDLGVPADRIGYQSGVHLIIDAGSAGSINFPCFRDYVFPAQKTSIKAFLNISRIGLVTKQPYYDERVVDVLAAEQCLNEDGGQHLLGVKVLASGLILENAGLEPLLKAVEVARRVGCPLLIHLAEGPPTNEKTMELLRQGDIITHCFHGAPNREAIIRAARGAPINPAYFSEDNIMWHEDGRPTTPLREALLRGVYLDVGHGAASLDQNVARAVIASGHRQFSISTDAHSRNVAGVVRDLPHTMSKFLGLGLTLEEVVASVTVIPAKQLGLHDWCVELVERATLFKVREQTEEDPPLLDSYGVEIEGERRIEAVGVIRQGRLSSCLALDQPGFASNICS